MTSDRQNIAVIGSGISGLSAAWLLSKSHSVTLFEAAPRLGGHTNTVLAQFDGLAQPVDTGFIVYNETTYPNLTAMFAHLGVATRGTDMSFAVSLRDGGLEYGSTSLRAIFAQKRNLLRPRFLGMLRDLARFYKAAPGALATLSEDISLGDYLEREGYGRAFREDHLLPQAAAIWSSSLSDIRLFPAAAFIRFFMNHGLLELDVHARPQWRTVIGGSRSYIEPLARHIHTVRTDHPITSIRREATGVVLVGPDRQPQRFDQVVVATHADQALAMLADPSAEEAERLAAIRYTLNEAVLHTDVALMPRRRAAWSAWNYRGGADGPGEVTYWMNLLQGFETPEPLLVSLNPSREPDPTRVLRREVYHHPLFDAPAMRAQLRLWDLQGERRTWFCGAHFGSGFHEDGLQAGLAVAEAIGGAPRPWTVPDASGRIFITARTAATTAAAA